MGLSNTNAFFEQFDKAEAHRRNKELQNISQLFQSEENAKSRAQQLGIFEQGQAQQASQFEASQDQQASQFGQSFGLQQAQQNIYAESMAKQNAAIDANIKLNKQNARVSLAQGVSQGWLKADPTPDTLGTFQGIDGKNYAPVDFETATKRQQDMLLDFQGRQQAMQIAHERGRLIQRTNAAVEAGLSLLDPSDTIGRNALRQVSGLPLDPNLVTSIISNSVKSPAAVKQIQSMYNAQFANFSELQASGAPSEDIEAAAAKLDTLGNIHRQVSFTFADPNVALNSGMARLEHTRAMHSVVGNIMRANPSINLNHKMGSPTWAQAIYDAAANDNTMTQEDWGLLNAGIVETSKAYSRPTGFAADMESLGLDLSGGAVAPFVPQGTPPPPPTPDDAYTEQSRLLRGETPAEIGDPRTTPMSNPNLIVARGVEAEDAVAALEEPTPEALQRIFLGEDKGDLGKEHLRSMLRTGNLEERVKALGNVIDDKKLWDKVKKTVTETIKSGKAPKPKEKKERGRPLGAGGGEDILKELDEAADTVREGLSSAASSVGPALSSVMDFLQPEPPVPPTVAKR
jgi:hypothetical protein